MEQHEHAMQRALELADAAYNGRGGRLHVALADVYVAAAREIRIGNYRTGTGRNAGPKYVSIQVVIPNPEPQVLEEDEPPEDDVISVGEPGPSSVEEKPDTYTFPPPDNSL